MTRTMVVPKPLLPPEIETLWLEYLDGFGKQIPEIQPTTIMKQCMRDAFYHGCIAVLIRNAPKQEGTIQ